MIAELGHFALILALAVALVQGTLPLLGAARGTRPDALTLTMGRYGADEGGVHQGLVLLDGSEGASIQLATCCRPIPGDEIKGYLGRGEGLMVHIAECPTSRRLFERDSERFIHIEWAEQPTRSFEVSLGLLLRNERGALAKVASAISDAEADIVHIDMGSEPGAEAMELKVLVTVRDRLHLAEVMRNLRRSSAVLRATRSKV